MAHRLLICGALSEKSVVRNVAFSGDIKATLSCLEKLGARILAFKDTVTIGGLSPYQIKDNTEIDCLESGSTIRFLLPICMLCGKRIVLKGSKRLLERPFDVYEKICRENGILFEKDDEKITVCGKLKAGEYSINGNVSSQFISGMLFALALIDEKSRINVVGDFESQSYCEMTVSALKKCGISVKRGNNSFEITGGSFCSFDETVEGDFSNAAYLEAFGMLGGNVSVKGLDNNSVQGDRVYKKMFFELRNGKKEFDLSNCPDLAPIMFSLSAVFGGARFTGTKRLSIKESDRSKAMAKELEKFGIDTLVGENFVDIKGGKLKMPDTCLSSYNDHRIVMAVSLLCSVVGGEIDNAEAVNKSFPDFFDMISHLGIEVIKVKD